MLKNEWRTESMGTPTRAQLLEKLREALDDPADRQLLRELLEQGEPRTGDSPRRTDLHVDPYLVADRPTERRDDHARRRARQARADFYREQEQRAYQPLTMSKQKNNPRVSAQIETQSYGGRAAPTPNPYTGRQATYGQPIGPHGPGEGEMENREQTFAGGPSDPAGAARRLGYERAVGDPGYSSPPAEWTRNSPPVTRAIAENPPEPRHKAPLTLSKRKR
jgi:hypothetical protein